MVSLAIEQAVASAFSGIVYLDSQFPPYVTISHSVTLTHLVSFEEVPESHLLQVQLSGGQMAFANEIDRVLRSFGVTVDGE